MAVDKAMVRADTAKVRTGWGLDDVMFAPLNKIRLALRIIFFWKANPGNREFPLPFDGVIVITTLASLRLLCLSSDQGLVTTHYRRHFDRYLKRNSLVKKQQTSLCQRNHQRNSMLRSSHHQNVGVASTNCREWFKWDPSATGYIASALNTDLQGNEI